MLHIYQQFLLGVEGILVLVVSFPFLLLIVQFLKEVFRPKREKICFDKPLRLE